MTDEDALESVRLSDLRAMDSLTQSLSRSSESFGRSIVSAFSRGVVEGKRFEDVLRSVGRSMTDSLLKTALKPLQSGLSSLLGTGVKSLSGLLTGGFGSLGGAMSVPVAPFADGGIVYDETIVDGIENTVDAFLSMMRGANTGKMLVRI